MVGRTWEELAHRCAQQQGQERVGHKSTSTEDVTRAARVGAQRGREAGSTTNGDTGSSSRAPGMEQCKQQQQHSKGAQQEHMQQHKRTGTDRRVAMWREESDAQWRSPATEGPAVAPEPKGSSSPSSSSMKGPGKT